MTSANLTWWQVLHFRFESAEHIYLRRLDFEYLNDEILIVSNQEGDKMKKLLAILFVAALAGCTAPPPLNFSVPDVGVSKAKIDAEVKAVTVTLARPEEAKGAMPMGIESITNFWKESLQEAIDRMAIFKDDSSNKVSLQVKILAFDIPSAGASMTTKSIARYEILNRANGAIIYTQDISAEGVVPWDHSFMGVTRARESINRAAQNNIKLFLQGLETVDVNKPMFPAASK